MIIGAANITTAAGDTAAFVQDSGDNIKCLWYTRASVAPPVASALPSFNVRAWAVLKGTAAAVTASGNVTSVVRNGVGDYTVTMTTAMADANYSVIGTAYQPNRNAIVTLDSSTPPTTTAFRIRVGAVDLNAGTASADAYDSARISIIVVA